MRLDTELVRRGLARSREQAAELIAAGRVAVGGQTAAKAATQVGQDAAITIAEPARARTTRLAAATSWRARWPPSPTWPSPGGAAWTRARRPAASPTCCSGPGRRRWSRSTSDTASWPGRCAMTRRVTVLDRVNVRQLTPEQVAPPPGPGHRGPVVHLADARAARAGRLRGPGRRFRAAGEAAVRGGQGPGRRGRRGQGSGPAGRGRRVRRRPRRCRPAWAWPESWPARFRDRPGTWSISCGCAAGRRRWTRPPCSRRSRKDLSETEADRAGRRAHRAARRT